MKQVKERKKWSSSFVGGKNVKLTNDVNGGEKEVEGGTKEDPENSVYTFRRET